MSKSQINFIKDFKIRMIIRKNRIKKIDLRNFLAHAVE